MCQCPLFSSFFSSLSTFRFRFYFVIRSFFCRLFSFFFFLPLSGLRCLFLPFLVFLLSFRPFRMLHSLLSLSFSSSRFSSSFRLLFLFFSFFRSSFFFSSSFGFFLPAIFSSCHPFLFISAFLPPLVSSSSSSSVSFEDFASFQAHFLGLFR